ncbi:MAG: quinone-dependent dihydroorotate dehydrogenase [Pseudomonadota bacterium]
MSGWRRGLERAGLAVLRCVDPERAHGLALAALEAGLGPGGGPVTSPRLATELAGLTLPNPIGIAAGFDKEGRAVGPLLAAGPGFVELGGVTPLPQPGNPRPRLFRLPVDGAVINRFGLNSAGQEAMAARLEAARAAGAAGVIGLNLGANKASADRAEDYVRLVRRLGPLADYLTVNVSSPNTERLRELQGPAALEDLLGRVAEAAGALVLPPPVFLKIAPDLEEEALGGIVEAALWHGLAGIVATNTTVAREGLRDRRAAEAGGLSGRPLFARSTAVLGQLRRLAGERLALVGVGGVGSAEEAYAKIRAGASAVQLYSALAYGGLSLAGDIARGLDALLARDGFARVAEAVGADIDG